MKTNDPRENKPSLFTYNSNREDGPIPSMYELNEKSNLALREDCKVVCFSKNFRNYQGCHLSKMWAQYGDNHKGVCLELDKNAFKNENIELINNNFFKDIIYTVPENRAGRPKHNINLVKFKSTGNLDYLKQELRPRIIDDFYFSKNDEWESEAEIRLLTFSNVKDNEYCSIEKSLVAIHLGVDFNLTYLPSIRQFTSQRYKVFQLKFLQDGLRSQLLENLVNKGLH